MTEKGQKFYSETESGSIIFRTERRIGDVRIPNYVYDMWLPLLGAVTIGVYGVYCRLEREGAVKGMTLKTIAQKCRLGTSRLDKVNAALEECGFVSIQKPEGFNRLRHYTTEITVLDPPQEISQEIIKKYQPSSGYEVLTPWLMEDIPKTQMGSPEDPNGFSEAPKQVLVETPNGSSKVASLILQSDDDDGPGQAAPSPPTLKGDQIEAYCCLRCQPIGMDFDQALKLAQTYDLEAVRGWCCVAWSRIGPGPGEVKNPAGFVHSKLTSDVLAPRVAPAQMREFTQKWVADYRVHRLPQEAERLGLKLVGRLGQAGMEA